MDIKGLFFRDIRNDHIAEILKEMYFDRIYDPYLDGKKDLTLVDVGANVGIWSFYAYPYAKTIYSLEPSKQHGETLTTMIKYNKMEDKIHLIPKALSHKNGTADFYHHPNSTMFSLKTEVNAMGVKETVETITLDSLFKDLNLDHVDFMKLDVEGSEGEILGSNGFDVVAPKIDTIVGEYHAWSGYNPNQIINCLKDHGYKTGWLTTEAQVFYATRI